MSFLLFSVPSEGPDLVAGPLTPPALLAPGNTGHVLTHIQQEKRFHGAFHTISLVLPIATAICKERIFTFIACHEKYIERYYHF